MSLSVQFVLWKLVELTDIWVFKWSYKVINNYYYFKLLLARISFNGAFQQLLNSVWLHSWNILFILSSLSLSPSLRFVLSWTSGPISATCPLSLTLITGNQLSLIHSSVKLVSLLEREQERHASLTPGKMNRSVVLQSNQRKGEREGKRKEGRERGRKGGRESNRRRGSLRAVSLLPQSLI